MSRSCRPKSSSSRRNLHSTSSSVDDGRLQRAVREILLAIGEDPDRSDLELTPARVAASYSEFVAGRDVDPGQFLTGSVAAGNESGELVALRDISFRSLCEHHLLPFHGVAHIAYKPRDRVIGLSSLPKVVETIASRLQLQERLGEQIAQAIQDGLDPLGVLVILEATHGCVTDRGVRQRDARTVTLASRGELAGASQRADAMALLSIGSARP